MTGVVFSSFEELHFLMKDHDHQMYLQHYVLQGGVQHMEITKSYTKHLHDGNNYMKRMKITSVLLIVLG
jgi:hypothetical protein